jgi:adenosylcobinamide-GDP ribazoletransferase
MRPPGTWRDHVADVKLGVLFCTRLPLPHAGAIAGADVARASWAFPIAGTLVACVGALVYATAVRLRLPPTIAAALALAATVLVTGALHEDGLADTADGFGGGGDAVHKLEIMRDSRIGSYGAAALTLSLILRWSALAAIAEPLAVTLALVAAHASARAPLSMFMRRVPHARGDGLAADAGRPPPRSVNVAVLLGVIALAITLGPIGALIGVLLLAASGVLMARLSMRQIGGQTGDVIGALEQINEILILSEAAALLHARMHP